MEWDEVEVGWALGYEAWRRENLCPLCGMPSEICQAPEGTYVFGTDAPVRCRVTTALRKAQAESREQPQPDALLHRPKVTPWGSPA